MVFRINQEDSVIVQRAKFCNASNLLQFQLDIGDHYAGSA